MNIERVLIPESTLDEFATTHGLTMEVVERDTHFVEPRLRFYAHFKGGEVKEGPILSGVFGNGHTEAEAIADYAKRISLKLLVFDAYWMKRREIRCPRFTA
jgi:hypothetical protein